MFLDFSLLCGIRPYIKGFLSHDEIESGRLSVMDMFNKFSVLGSSHWFCCLYLCQDTISHIFFLLVSLLGRFGISLKW